MDYSFPTDYQEILNRIENVHPIKYAKTRNFINGQITYLSPYISRGVISVKQVKDIVLNKGFSKYESEKFIQELAWREYFQRVWQSKKELIWSDLKHTQEDVKHHHIPTAVVEAQTGIEAIDQQINNLFTTGYMHNHIRMYLASITCNMAKSHWLVPSKWMYYHLLDGDIASNNCSWQWVAGAFSTKKYYCNQENINKYTFSKQQNSFLDKSYEQLVDMPIPDELQETTKQVLKTKLPETTVPEIDIDLPTVIYNSYNLDPNWRKLEKVNRVLLLEPSHFNQFPVSDKVIEFILQLSKNIEGIQIFTGEIQEIKNIYKANNVWDVQKIISKEHLPFLVFGKKFKNSSKMKSKIGLVWFKRDLRLQDHAALDAAEKSGLPLLYLWLIEPEEWSAPENSLRHWLFQWQSILQINEQLAPLGRKIEICFGAATDVFSSLIEQFTISQVFSYQESGSPRTYKRDLDLKKLFEENTIEWQEFQRDGIIRGLKNRKNWDRAWFAYVNSPSIENHYLNVATVQWQHAFQLPNEIRELLDTYPNSFQKAGPVYAEKYLADFLTQRVHGYQKGISKPALSRKSCSRLSPFLAWGNLSVRQVVRATAAYMNKVPEQKYNFEAFLTRLHWHCHFIQKFETDCTYATHCINKAYENAPYPKNDYFLEAWKSGQTGFPLVDANMRCLAQTGWINFRMRALLVSFLCHNLLQDWKDGVHHMARLFLDFEPGIHYPQFQMQAGTTGVNTINTIRKVCLSGNGYLNLPNSPML